MNINKTLLLITSIGFCLLLNAQTNNKYNIKIHHSASVYYFHETFISSTYIKDKNPRYSIEANQKLSKFFDAGVYLGYCIYNKYQTSENTNNQFIGYLKRPILFYGLNSNYHLLPLFIKKEDFWVDLYIAGKIGAISFIGSKFPSGETNKPFEYGIYAGLALYPLKHCGLFFEYGKGNFIDKRFGLSLKF